MFEQINLLLSFVFALAMTHLLSTGAELLLARSRVVFSGPHAIWIVNAVLMLLVNWLATGNVGSSVEHWSPGLVAMLFVQTVMLYLVCATLSIKVREHERVDMPAFFEGNRLVIFGAMIAGSLSGMVLNYMGRNFAAHSDDWIKADGAILAGLAVIAVAALAKPKWVQWSAAVVYGGLTITFFVTIAVPQ